MAMAAVAGSHTGVKRKSSIAGLPGSTRPAKRRASKACHCCRSRKVRCDVVESGIPCTNCRLDEVECVVTEGKRRKKSYVEGDVLHHSPIQSIEEREEVQKFPLFDDIDAFNDLQIPLKQPEPVASDVRLFDYELKHHRPHLIYQTQGHRLSPEERTRRISSFNSIPRLSITPVQLPPHLQYHPPTPSRPEIVLPHYIAPIPRQMLSEDLEYLQRKGAFHLPETSIRNELLRSYVQYVHPYLPLLDLEDFLTAIDQNRPSSNVSLLLYQAVMFAASAYIDMRYLCAQGFSSRKSARKAYFQRVKLLYDFDWEIDRVTVVQSVLLMTYWYESPNDPKDVWYWLGIAISIARTIGLNYSTEGITALTPQKQRLWKRVWWSTYLRDRVIAIGMRRPIRIRDEDFDVPLLELDDFETNPLPPDLCRMLGGCSAVRDGSKRKTLAKMCIALTQVCRLMTDVLAIQYSTLGHKLGATSETTVRLVPRATGAEPSEVIRCDRELEEWYSALPLELRYFKPGGRDRTDIHDGEVISVHRALLTSIYLTTSSALHRPQMMPAMPNLVVDAELKELSRHRVHNAALDITEIYRDLYAHDLIRYLPNTGVTVLLPAIIIHLMDIKSNDATDKQASMRHFQFCMQALQKLRDLYSSADFAFSFLDAAIKKSDIAADEPSKLIPEGRTNSVSSKATRMFQPSVQGSTLTPPPDVHDGASRYVDQSSLSYTGRDRIDALTPPSHELSSNFNVGNHLAMSLRELEQFVGLDDIADDQHNPIVFTSMDSEQSSGPEPAECEPMSLVLTNKVSPTVNEFDRLMNMESGPDLFAPNQVSIDDSLFKDIDMEWLADSNEEDASTTSSSDMSSMTPEEVKAPSNGNPDTSKLPATPISCTTAPSIAKPKDDEAKTPIASIDSLEPETKLDALVADGCIESNHDLEKQEEEKEISQPVTTPISEVTPSESNEITSVTNEQRS